jgi:GAF domain-containing protein
LTIPLENTLERLAATNPIQIENLKTSSENGQILSFFTRRGCSSAAIFGIVEDKDISFILAVGGFEDASITPEKLASLVDLSKISGIILRDLHLIGKLQSRLTELEALASVSKAISVETDLNNLFILLHSQVKALIGSDVSFAVTIYNHNQEMIEIPFMVEDDQVVNIPPFPLGEGLSSVVIKTQKPLLLRNQQQAISMGAKVIGKISQSWLGVPLIIGSDVIGTMMVQDSEHEDRFDETDLNVFLTLSPQVAVAIRNAQLFNQVEGSLSQHKLLHRITVETAAANTIGEAIQTTVDLLHHGFEGSKIAVLLKNDQNILTIQYSSGFELEMVADLAIPIGQGVIGLVAETRKSIIVNDVTQEPDYIVLDPEVLSEMAVPITFKGEILGVLDIELPEKNAFLSNEEDIFGTLGNNLGAVIASARLLEDVRVQIATQQQLFDATAKIRQSVDMKSIMETSATEIGRITGARRVSIRINPDITPTMVPGNDSGKQPVMEASE